MVGFRHLAILINAPDLILRMKNLNNDILTKQLLLRSLSTKAISSLATGNLEQAEINEGIKFHPDLKEHMTAFAHDLSQIKTDAQFRNWSTRAVLLRTTREMVGISGVTTSAYQDANATAFFRPASGSIAFDGALSVPL